MSEQNQNNAGTASASKGRGASGATAKASPARVRSVMNPENPPDLIAKFRKEFGVTLSEIKISYNQSGTIVKMVILKPLCKEGEQAGKEISPAEYGLRLKAHKASVEKTEDQILDAQFKFVSLYEKRLNKEFPSKGPEDFGEAGIKRWVLTQPFEDRKILMMNAKQFRKHARAEESEEEDD